MTISHHVECIILRTTSSEANLPILPKTRSQLDKGAFGHV